MIRIYESGLYWFTIAAASFYKPRRCIHFASLLRGEIFMGEIFTTAILCFTLILVGLALGFGLLKIQGGEE
jgi:cytochrome b6-f complex subunit 7